MLLRFCLILTILAGAGVIAVSHFQVRPHIQGIIDVRNAETARANKLDADLKVTKKELQKTQGELADTKKKLSEAETELASAKTQLDVEQKRANSLKIDLEATRARLSEASQELSRWKLLGVTPEEVKIVMDNYKKLQDESAAMHDEIVILNRHVAKLTNIIANITGTSSEVYLPPTLKGKVLVVDPKWDFVVINIGEKDGALVNGVMLVSRNSKLVGKVRISSVLPDRSIANILPNWKLDEVMEGDTVIP